MPTRNLITLALFTVAALTLFQFVARVGEYWLCLNDRRHAATSYADDDDRIRVACRKLHLTFPF